MKYEFLGRRTVRHFKSAGLRRKYERGEISRLEATHPVTVTRVQAVGAGLKPARTPHFFSTPPWAIRPLLTDMMRPRKAGRE